MSYEILAQDTEYSFSNTSGSGKGLESTEHVELVVKVHEVLLEEIEAVELLKLDYEAQVEIAAETVVRLVRQLNIALPAGMIRQLANEVVAEISGNGPIGIYLEDPTITEVMVNGPKDVYIERDGRLHKQDRVFKDNAHVMKIIERIVARVGRRIDESSPMVDARLPEGHRVNAIIPPLALNGPTLTVRKFAPIPFTAQKLVEIGAMSEEMLEFFETIVKAKVTVMISGGTGSGKTTTLNTMSAFIPNDERIITIEDAAELKLQQEHVVKLECRPPNIEGKGEITTRMLVRNALRMRPDRIIVGEVRDAAAIDMLQAMNTGHEGSLSTLHANSPRDALSRLETLVLFAGTDLPSRAIREQIASAITIIIHQSRLRDGSRKIVEVAEVQGMEGETLLLQDIFRYEQRGIGPDGNVIGEHVATGLRPRVADRLMREGIELPAALFVPRIQRQNKK